MKHKNTYEKPYIAVYRGPKRLGEIRTKEEGLALGVTPQELSEATYRSLRYEWILGSLQQSR